MESHELQLFIHNVEDIESWIADMEGQLASEDHGKDLISVNNLLKKHAVSARGKGVHMCRDGEEWCVKIVEGCVKIVRKGV